MKFIALLIALVSFQNLAEARARQYFAADTDRGHSLCFEWVNGQPVGAPMPDGYCASGNFQITASDNGYWICVNKDRRGVPYGGTVNYGNCAP